MKRKTEALTREQWLSRCATVYECGLAHAAQDLREDMRKKEKESAAAQKGSND